MARFSFGRCTDCGRLNIYGARCVCSPRPELDCDCETGGELGPKCAARERERWSTTIRASHEIAAQFATATRTEED